MTAIDVILIMLQVLFFLVLGRVLMSWIPLFTQKPLDFSNPLVRFLFEVTEPILAPIRRYTMVGMIDLSPIVVIILIQIVSAILVDSA